MDSGGTVFLNIGCLCLYHSVHKDSSGTILRSDHHPELGVPAGSTSLCQGCQEDEYHKDGSPTTCHHRYSSNAGGSPLWRLENPGLCQTDHFVHPDRLLPVSLLNCPREWICRSEAEDL